ncbi:MAG: metal ABC transporter permease [Solirubrobacteraceae bacterium]
MFAHDFVRNAYLAGTFISLACGIVGWFVVLIGTAFAWILGIGVFLLALLAVSAAGGNGIAGVNTLFGSIYELTPGAAQLAAAIALVVTAGVAVAARPLLLCTLDAELAAVRGIPVRVLGILFLLALAIVTAQSTQAVGALLLLGLLAAPAGAAHASARDLTSAWPCQEDWRWPRCGAGWRSAMSCLRYHRAAPSSVSPPAPAGSQLWPRTSGAGHRGEMARGTGERRRMGVVFQAAAGASDLRGAFPLSDEAHIRRRRSACSEASVTGTRCRKPSSLPPVPPSCGAEARLSAV